MNYQELIEKIGNLDRLYGEKFYVALDDVLVLVKQLDEPETGHADEAPRYVKNILARLRELPLHDREVWLKAIMSEFEQDFSHAKWREGYEQGKFEGEWAGQQLKGADKIRGELNKVKVKQFVADWYEENKDDFEGNLYRCTHNIPSTFDGARLNEFERWFLNASTKPFQTLINMHQFGYEVEKEKRYLVKVKGVCGNHETLNCEKHSKKWLFSVREENSLYKTKHTRKELEEAGFGWVFDCPGVEVEEVG
ncbi:DUF1642 domain-containing protein [Streptococcus pseudopneumoniae]|uniref:DUF1642 domain-containing protein n=1 Tax=Streptococcus pseudopneumoniae TaxID=257758 RepID=UPI00066CEEDE|nr:DUF1642 domain-containing protein [Streptococcus pseudopneumoniae]